MQIITNTLSTNASPQFGGYYTMKEVCALTRFSRTHIYRLEASGKFPRRRKLGLAKIGFLCVEVDHWIANRPFAELRSEDDE